MTISWYNIKKDKRVKIILDEGKKMQADVEDTNFKTDNIKSPQQLTLKLQNSGYEIYQILF